MQEWGIERQSDFALTLGISKTYTSDLLAGKKAVGEQVLFSLADRGVDLNWLLTGRGQMLREAGHEPPAHLDLSRQREEFEAKLRQKDERIADLRRALKAAEAMADWAKSTGKEVVADRVSERESAAYLLSRIRVLEQENEELQNRLKKLGLDEKATANKEG